MYHFFATIMKFNLFDEEYLDDDGYINHFSQQLMMINFYSYTMIFPIADDEETMDYYTCYFL